MGDTVDTDGLGKEFENFNIKTLEVGTLVAPVTDDGSEGTIVLSANLEVGGDGLILYDLNKFDFSTAIIVDGESVITYEDDSTATATYVSATVITSNGSKTITTEENINLNGRTYTITQSGTTITMGADLKKIISLESGNLVIATYKSDSTRIDKEIIMDTNNSIAEIANVGFDLKVKSLDVTKTDSINQTAPAEGSVRIDATLSVAGATTLNGAVTLGDATGDDITITGRVASHIIPKTDLTYDLGTTALGFNDLHLGLGGVINLDGGDVTLTHSAGKLTLGGDGAVEFDFANHEMTNVDINSGAIDGTIIGAESAVAGTFTTLTVNDELIIAAGATITGDTTNQITLAITGVSGQSANLLTVEQSDGTDKLTVNSSGVTTAASLVVSTSLTITPSVITSASTSIGSPTDLDESISVFYFDLNSASAMYGIFAAGTTGQMINIFYDNHESAGSLKIDFGATKLRTGSGESRYLTFTITGQSASLMYISTVDKWCVTNTGAAVS